MNTVLQALLLGISYGFGPCTFSCAPVLVPIVMSTSKNYKQGFLQTLVFSLGRIVVYVALGLLMGGIGSQLNVVLPPWVLGIFMIGLGIALIFQVQNRCLVSKVRVTGVHMVFVAGVLMGLSPCAPMLVALGLAIASKSVLMGGLIALVFGLGTILSPLLAIGLISGTWASLKEFAGINSYIAGGFLVVLGLLNLFQ